MRSPPGRRPGLPAGVRVPSSPQGRPPLHPTPPASPPDGTRLSTPTLPDGQPAPRRPENFAPRARGGGGRQGSGKGGRRRDGRVEGEPHARNHCPPEPTTAHHSLTPQDHCPPGPTRALRPETTAHHSPTPDDHSPPAPTRAHQGLTPSCRGSSLPTTAHHNPPQPTTALRSGQRRPTGAVSRFGWGPTSGRTPRAVTAQGRPRSAAGSVGICTLCAAPLVHTTTGRREQRIPSALLNLSCEPAD